MNIRAFPPNDENLTNYYSLFSSMKSELYYYIAGLVEKQVCLDKKQAKEYSQKPIRLSAESLRTFA